MSFFVMLWRLQLTFGNTKYKLKKCQVFIFTILLVIGCGSYLAGMAIAVWFSERSPNDSLYTIGTSLVAVGYVIIQSTSICTLFVFIKILVKFSTEQAKTGIINLNKRDSNLIGLATRMCIFQLYYLYQISSD